MSFFKRFLDPDRSRDAEKDTRSAESESSQDVDAAFEDDLDGEELEPDVEEDDIEDEPPGPITFEPNGTIRFNIGSVPEAKLALKELRLAKRELQAEKRALSEGKRQIQAEYTSKVRGRGQMMRGGGSFGRFVRGVQSSSRTSERQQHAKNLAPYENARATIEARINTIDRAELSVERYILENDPKARG